MRVAIVHDYLTQTGGAERVVVALHRIFPTAPIYTTIFDPDGTWPELREADVRTSWMQRLPGMPAQFKKYLVLYPYAVESFALSGFDLIVSSSSAFAKGVVVGSDALHVCYCHNPMRFIWDYERYVAGEALGLLTRAVLPFARRYLRRWDLQTATRPHALVANSSAVAQRIRRYYGRTSKVIPPPVNVEAHSPSADVGPYHLIVSRLSGYKRIDIAVEAFNRLGLPLVIVGEGPARPVLERRARSNIRFMGRLPDREVAQLYARCRALIFPGEEDFGIAPIEANAAGRPVVAYAGGGALETVVDGQTGVLFTEQTSDALAQAVHRTEGLSWDSALLRRHAEGYSEAAFRHRLLTFLEGLLGRPLELERR